MSSLNLLIDLLIEVGTLKASGFETSPSLTL
jgi:hypothetical protein